MANRGGAGILGLEVRRGIVAVIVSAPVCAPASAELLITIGTSQQRASMVLARIERQRWPVSTGRRNPATPTGSFRPHPSRTGTRGHTNSRRCSGHYSSVAAMRCTAPWSCTIPDIQRGTTACDDRRGRRLRRPLAQKSGRDEQEGDRAGQAAHTRRDDLSRVGER